MNRRAFLGAVAAMAAAPAIPVQAAETVEFWGPSIPDMLRWYEMQRDRSRLFREALVQGEIGHVEGFRFYTTAMLPPEAPSLADFRERLFSGRLRGVTETRVTYGETLRS